MLIRDITYLYITIIYYNNKLQINLYINTIPKQNAEREIQYKKCRRRNTMPDRNNMSKCMCGMELLVQFQLNYRECRTLRNANIYIIRKIT